MSLKFISLQKFFFQNKGFHFYYCNYCGGCLNGMTEENVQAHLLIIGTFLERQKLRKCVSANIFLHAIFQKMFCIQLCCFYSATLLFLKKPLSTIFFTNTVGHHLIFFMNCCPSEIIVFFILFFKVESGAQVEMQELLDVCYN